MNKRKIVSAILLAILFLVWLALQRDTGSDIGINNNQTITATYENISADIQSDNTINDIQDYESGNDEQENETEAVVTGNNSDGEIQTNEIDNQIIVEYRFRNKKLLMQHFEKHGEEMGFANATEYEKRASEVVNDPNTLHKTEKEDGDDVYYLEESNEFVIVSTDGYIRTYFNPSGGINYYNKQ